MSESKASQYKPKYFSTDKDSAQINPIRAVLWWHMKRAVKKKTAKNPQDERLRILKEDAARLIQLLHKQYCISPHLDGNRTLEQVRIRCA